MCVGGVSAWGAGGGGGCMHMCVNCVCVCVTVCMWTVHTYSSSFFLLLAHNKTVHKSSLLRNTKDLSGD